MITFNTAEQEHTIYNFEQDQFNSEEELDGEQDNLDSEEEGLNGEDEELDGEENEFLSEEFHIEHTDIANYSNSKLFCCYHIVCYIRICSNHE